MKFFGLMGLCVATAVLSGCVTYRAPVMPPPGVFFTSVQAPLDTDAAATNVGSKVGMSSSVSVFGMFAFGDASVESAARDGNISSIHHLDYEYLNVLFLFQKFTTRAHGE